jgi:hypothetical protein
VRSTELVQELVQRQTYVSVISVVFCHITFSMSSYEADVVPFDGNMSRWAKKED